MVQRIEVVAILVSILTLLGILELVRRKLLKEAYSLLWIASSMGMIVLAIWRSLLDWIAHLLGIYYPPVVLFLTAGLGGFFLAIHFSIVLSRLSDENRRLAQELALLSEEVRRLKDSPGEDPLHRSTPRSDDR